MNLNIIENINQNKSLSKLFNNHNVSKLIKLYQESQIENQRNKRLTPEVGTAREKDLISYIIFILKNTHQINYKINNECEEDLKINDRKISIKHSSNRTNTKGSIKIKWTQTQSCKEKFMKTFEFECDLIIVYVRMADDINKGNIEVISVSKEKLNDLRKLVDYSIFKSSNTSNERGIEFSAEFFKLIMKNLDYHCRIEYTNSSNTIHDLDCIANRLNKLLKL